MSTHPEQDRADREMLAAVAAGDQPAFARLYDRLSPPLYAMVLEMLRDEAEAEDTLQEIFLRIWHRARTYDPARSSVFTWAVLIARGKSFDRLRARHRRLQPFDPQTHAVATADAPGQVPEVEQGERLDQVKFMLDGLPAEQREAIALAFLQGLTHDEISSRLRQPLGTIKARIRRGLERLRDHMTRTPGFTR